MKLHLLLGVALLASAVACSDGDDKDGGTQADAGMEPQDSGPPADSGLVDAGRADTGVVRDAGSDGGVAHCTMQDQIAVGAANIMVGAASGQAQTANNAPSDLTCLDRGPEPDVFEAPIFIRSCLSFVGDPITAAQVDDLDVAVFLAVDGEGNPTDPSFDFNTGRDRQPSARKNVVPRYDTTIAPTACPSRIQMEIGYDARGADALVSEREYIIRIRTASTAAQPVVATMFVHGVIVRNAEIGGAPADLSECTTQQCYNRHNLTLVRSAQLAAAIAGATTPVPGSADLTDGLGSGYGMIEAYDCGEIPMTHAVAGFAPAPLNDAYPEADLGFARTETSERGIYLAVGFPGQSASSSTAIQAAAGVGAARGGECTEEFAGTTLWIYSDSISVFRSSNETILHAR